MLGGVIGHKVTGSNYCARNLRTRGYKSADQEKCSLYFLSRQHFEQPLRMQVIRTVVVSQSQMRRIRRIRQRPAIKLRSGSIAVIREVSHPCNCASDGDFGEHD